MRAGNGTLQTAPGSDASPRHAAAGLNTRLAIKPHARPPVHLQGAAYWLLRHAISYALDDPDSSGPDVLTSRLCPLFGRLALSHRLAVLAELAEGLLCPDTPLPPDTLHHHAALLFIFESITWNIENECDVVGWAVQY